MSLPFIFSHVDMRVRDRIKAIAFYDDLLGLLGLHRGETKPELIGRGRRKNLSRQSRCNQQEHQSGRNGVAAKQDRREPRHPAQDSQEELTESVESRLRRILPVASLGFEQPIRKHRHQGTGE